MTTYLIDLALAQTSGQLHQQLREVFSLPDYYGMNMDALWDCLNGSFQEPVRIEVRHEGEAAPELARTVGILRGLLRDLEEENANVSVCYGED